MWSSTVIVNLNNQWLYNLTDVGEFGVAWGSKIFTAASIKNAICFDSVYDLGDKIKYPWIGPCIDNVTLVKITTSPTPSNTTNTTTNTSNNTTNNTNTTNNSTSPDNINNSNTSNISQDTNSTTYSQNQTHPPTTRIPRLVTISCKTSSEELDNKIIFPCLYDNIGIEIISYLQNRIEIYLED